MYRPMVAEAGTKVAGAPAPNSKTRNPKRIAAMKTRARWALWIGFTGLLVGATVVAVADEAEEAQGGGTIVGTATYAGKPPARQNVLIDKDVDVCGVHQKLTETLIVSAQNKGIQNVVVSLSGVTKGKPLEVPEETFTLDQKGCWFSPHIQIVPVGATIDILNEDGIMHNIHTLSIENPSFNKAQPKFKKKMQFTPEYGETIRVKCDIHNWMGGWIIVVEHPYHALTDESGAFRITDVPPGTYTLEYWHETLGRSTKQVTVTSGADTVVDIALAPKITE